MTTPDSPSCRPQPGNWTFALMLVLVVYCMMLPGEAWATATVGDVIQGGARNYRTLPRYLNYVSYIAGLIVSVIGIQKLRLHVDRPDQVPFSHGAWHLAGGVFLISLPAAWNILARSFRLFTASGATQTAVGSGISMTVSASTPLSLDVMMIRFVNNVRAPIQYTIWTLSAVLGLFFLISAFLRMARGAAVDGPRGSLGSGTLGRIFIGSILLSIAATSDVFTSTFFSGSIVKFDGMSIPGVAASDLTRANQAMAAVLVFVQIIGFIAFMRGFLMLRALADGNQSISSAAAFTHIIGGSLAFNISPFLSALQRTFCPSGSGCNVLGFS